jgi:hypothetical protein
MLHDGENDSVVTDDTCEIRQTWNASVCTGDIGRLSLAVRRGFTMASLTAPRPPQEPIALIRNGKEFRITDNQSTVRAGTEMQIKTNRKEVALSMSEMEQGSWVIFELPGFAKAASGTQLASMDALRKANETSYYKGADALWVKMVVTEPPLLPISPLDTQASIAVSR